MMLKEKIVFNKKFLKVFTEDELQDIVDSAISLSADCIVISTDDNFFELSADRDEELDIYCDVHNNSSAKKLSKDEFMKLYKSSPIMGTVQLNIDE